MRIMLTVLGEQGDRDVVVDGDDGATVAGVGAALIGHAPLAEVVHLPKTRAPYGLSSTGGSRGAHARIPRPRAPERADPLSGPVLWRNGHPLDPRAPAASVLRDGDKVALDARLARATVIEEPGGVAEVRVVGGPAAGAVHRLGLGVHVIGSDPMCAMAAADPALAPEAVTVRVTPDAITVERAFGRLPGQAPRLRHKGRWADEVAELTARTADREAAAFAADHGEIPELDGKPLTEPAEWPDQAVLTCGSSVFVLTSIEPKDAHLAPRGEGGLSYNRPPRLLRPEPERTFVKPKEPTRNEGMRLQLLAAFLPAVLGLTLAFALHVWYYLLVALMTPVIMIGQWWSDRRHGKKKHRQALKEFAERIRAYDEKVERARTADEATRRADAPDPAQVLLTATGPRRRLWERRIHDADSLRLRVGLADLPANLELSEDQGGPIDPPMCRAVPVALAMRRLGVAGVTGPRTAATSLTSWLIAQAATLHSPRDLAIVIVSAHPDGERRWGWTRWLPHCAPRAGEDCVALVGTDPESAARRVSELAALIDERQNTAIPEFGKIPTGWDDLGGPEKPTFSSYDVRPHDVLVILDGAQVLRGLPNMPQVLRQGPRSGVFTLAIDEDQRLLPEECQTVAACGTDGLVRLGGGGLDVIGPILADLVSATWCDRLARALSPIRDVSRDDAAGNLPDAVRLLDLMSLPAPSGRELAVQWRRHGSTKALIGVGPDGPFSVDLTLDGPHGLIAGTTGAGKSELLQTLICSLAVANRPDQLTFVLIDYKGGAAFKECVRLPHTVGMVSDLDGHLTQRALDSLAAEIRRRELLLNAAGAKDIEDYTGADPLPRLVLIIDEFAALVAELPDFVAGLVDIARRGRSLGIHLILATQRPAGVVTADIQANTSLRIALRVTEPAESTDVIDLPDAANISKSTPGRCYVRVGVGAAVAVQTARVGGRSPARSPQGVSEGPSGHVRVLDVDWRSLGKPLPTPPEPEEEAGTSDLSLVADALIEATRLAGVPAQHSPWLAPLPTHLVLDLPTWAGHEADEFTEVAPLAFGVTDRPWAQDRRPLALDLVHGGHVLIAGAARSGRSTALRTIAGSIAAHASPADVHVHAVDCGSGALLPLMAMPHCGAVVTRDQLDRVERLLTRLRAEVGRRQQLLAEAGHASLAEYRQAGHRVPWLVFLLDRWEGFVAAFESYDYGRLIEALLQLLREGPAVGLRAVVTSDRSGLMGQVSTVFDDRLLLRLSDPSDYGLAGFPLKGLPSSMPPGRALSMGEHGIVEHHIALLSSDPAGPAQVAALQALARLAAVPGEEPESDPATVTGSGALADATSNGYGRSDVPRGSDTRDAASATDTTSAGGRSGVGSGVGDESGAVVDRPTAADGTGTTMDGLRAVESSSATGDGSRPVKDSGAVVDEPTAADGTGATMDGLRAVKGSSATGDGSRPVKDSSTTGDGSRAVKGSGATGDGSRAVEGFGATGDGSGVRRGSRSAHERLVPVGKGGWRWEGEPPLRVDALPMRITASQAMDLDPAFRAPSPLWALVGAGGDALAPLGIDLLAQGPGAVIAGPSRSGRSSVLVTAARSLIVHGTPVIAIAPRRSPLRDLVGALAVLDGNATNLQELVADQHHYVVVVDDAELINADGPLGTALEEVLRSGRDGDHGLLIAGATGDLAVSYRGFVAETRKSRTGLLLSVQGPTDGDLFSIRLPRGAGGGPPGRGILVTTGNVVQVQAALPDPT